MASLRNLFASQSVVPAFNFNDQHELAGIIVGLERAGSPAVLQVSARATEYSPIEVLHDMFNFYRNRTAIPIWIELDHGTDLSIINRAAELGFDVVMADFATMPFPDNIKITASVVEDLVHSGMLVEGQVSPIRDNEGAAVDSWPATPSVDLSDFIRQTNVDLVAPSIGTLHGVGVKKPRIDQTIVRSLVSTSTVPLVAHGCDFMDPKSIKTLTRSGVQKLNFGPQLRAAYCEAMASVLSGPNAEKGDQRKAHRAAELAVAREVEKVISCLA